jgi:hypothetical protein
MRARFLLTLAIFPLTIPAPAQDWQHCKPEGSYSFTEVKEAVRRVTTSHIYFSWDEKMFSRSGDLASVAIVQTLTDKEMTSPKTLESVLGILRAAFACTSRCVTAPSDRQPRVALLLLEHLDSNASKQMQTSIDETKKFIIQQAPGVE